jgi:hypothetical protein
LPQRCQEAASEPVYRSLSRVVALKWLEEQVGIVVPVARDYFVDANRRGWRIHRDRNDGEPTSYAVFPVGEEPH